MNQYRVDYDGETAYKEPIIVVDNDNDDTLNAKLQFEYENWIEHLDGIQREDLEWVMKKYTVDNDNYVHGKPINSNSNDGNENDDDTFHHATQGQVYYDSNNDDDTFHVATQVEDVIEDIYDDEDDINRKPINNVIDDTDDDDDHDDNNDR